MTKRIRWKDDPELRDRFKGRRVKARKPYLLRGRRVRFAQCLVCGEFNPKQSRIIKTKELDRQGDSITFREVYITCRFHDETLVSQKRI